MPWEFKKVEDKRKELIDAYIEGGSMTDLWKRYRSAEKQPTSGSIDISRLVLKKSLGEKSVTYVTELNVTYVYD